MDDLIPFGLPIKGLNRKNLTAKELIKDLLQPQFFNYSDYFMSSMEVTECQTMFKGVKTFPTWGILL